MAEEVKVYDWEDEISDDGNGNFVTLEDGDYDFEVVKFERGHFTPSASSKTPACNQANITIKIHTDAGDCYIVDKFPLASTMEWKASSFFRAIGLKKHGEPLKMRWPESIGCKGRVRIKKTQGNKDGVYFNNVDHYNDPVKVEDDEWS